MALRIPLENPGRGRPITAWLSDEVVDRLEVEALKRNISRGAAVRLAVSAGLNLFLNEKTPAA